jgi:hypothetical protein
MPLEQSQAPREYREQSKPGHPALAHAYDEVFDELKKMSVTAVKTSDDACPDEHEITITNIEGMDTAHFKDTAYGNYLDRLKDESLVMPEKAPTLDGKQTDIAELALKAVRDAMNAEPGSLEWRRAMQDLRGAFNTRTASDPLLSADYFKAITDHITLALAKTHPHIRLGTSSVSGAVVAGFKDSDGKFKTFMELRNEIVCPPNPYK